jgi:hypothetical protein
MFINFFNTFRYEARLQDKQEDETHIIRRRRTRQQQSQVNTTMANSSQLSDLIREENNFQCLNIERQNIVEMIENLQDPISPATAEFIAKFRLEYEQNRRIVNTDMAEKQIQCTPCQNDLKLHEFYASWPCSGRHLFHYECMLKSLRTRNTCPNCRHQVEGVPTTTIQATIQRFLFRLLA